MAPCGAQGRKLPADEPTVIPMRAVGAEVTRISLSDLDNGIEILPEIPGVEQRIEVGAARIFARQPLFQNSRRRSALVRHEVILGQQHSGRQIMWGTRQPQSQQGRRVIIFSRAKQIGALRNERPTFLLLDLRPTERIKYRVLIRQNTV